MPPPQSSSIGVFGFIAFVASGALLSFSLHKIEEGYHDIDVFTESSIDSSIIHYRIKTGLCWILAPADQESDPFSEIWSKPAPGSELATS